MFKFILRQIVPTYVLRKLPGNDNTRLKNPKTLDLLIQNYRTKVYNNDPSSKFRILKPLSLESSTYLQRQPVIGIPNREQSIRPRSVDVQDFEKYKIGGIIY